jgi:hypothetical protein
MNPANPQRRLEFVIAGDTKEVVENKCGKDVWRFLADNGFIERKSVSCVGFRRNIDDNSLLVILPKAFGTPENRERLDDPSYEREQIYRLIRVFRKIRRETLLTLDSSPTNKVLGTETFPIDPVLDAFDAALRLRHDFRERGGYFKKSAGFVANALNLPVDWSRTLQRGAMLLDSTSVFFSDTVHHTRRRDTYHPLSLLHVACLKEIFLLTNEKNDLTDLEALDPKEFQKVKNRPKEHLRKIRAMTFDERGRFLLAAISSYLGQSSLNYMPEEKRDELLCFSRDFEDIWERVLRDLIAPNLENRTLPPGKWHGWLGHEPQKGIQPEFDIRISNDFSDVLIDAKDYRILNGSKNKQGSTGDHYKQIIYRQLLDKSTEGDVVNILAFPRLGQKNLFEIRGCHHWEEIPSSCVFEVNVDYDLAIKRWLGETHLVVDLEMAKLLTQLRELSLRIKV